MTQRCSHDGGLQLPRDLRTAIDRGRQLSRHDEDRLRRLRRRGSLFRDVGPRFVDCGELFLARAEPHLGAEVRREGVDDGLRGHRRDPVRGRGEKAAVRRERQNRRHRSRATLRVVLDEPDEPAGAQSGAGLTDGVGRGFDEPDVELCGDEEGRVGGHASEATDAGTFTTLRSAPMRPSAGVVRFPADATRPA